MLEWIQTQSGKFRTLEEWMQYQKEIEFEQKNKIADKNIVLMTMHGAKGLEFDAVIVWQASASRSGADDERQLLYTICSRAMHRLSVIGVGELSPLLNDVPENEYERV